MIRPLDLKRLDVVVGLWLAARPELSAASYEQLAMELGTSPSQVHGAVMGLCHARMAEGSTKRVLAAPLLEFLGHGLRFAFPARPGHLAIGVPTAHSAPPLNAVIQSDEPYVWPDANGTVRGLAVVPLYKSVPEVARRNTQFHELMALADALRVGRARERSLALDEIRKRLSPERT